MYMSSVSQQTDKNRFLFRIPLLTVLCSRIIHFHLEWQWLFLSFKIKNNHLNQAIHEEREAIIELRVQLRLLQLQRAKPEPQAQDDEQEKRASASQLPREGAPETKAVKEQPKAGKEPAKPSPSRDRKETPIWVSILWGMESSRTNTTCVHFTVIPRVRAHISLLYIL